ncbi:MAG: hypothetical protein JRK53_02200 [Deltaproteobacteria bacterium]|nr:hypothetical protein [Deltaproteobacteria bacterium]
MASPRKIEKIKSGIDLAALIESKSVSLKKNGKGFVGLCPFRVRPVRDDQNTCRRWLYGYGSITVSHNMGGRRVGNHSFCCGFH